MERVGVRRVGSDAARVSLDGTLRRCERSGEKATDLRPLLRCGAPGVRARGGSGALGADLETHRERLERSGADEEIVHRIGVRAFEDGVQALVERGAERARQVAAFEGLRSTPRMDLGSIARAGAAMRGQRESVGAQDLVGRRHPLPREVACDQRRGRQRARQIELEGAQEILELALRLAGVATPLRRADVGLGTGPRRERVGRPGGDRAEQLERQCVDLVERGRLGERLLRAVCIAGARMEHADAHSHRRGRHRIVVALDLAQLRGGEARLAEALEPPRERMAQLGIVDGRQRSQGEPDRRVELGIAHDARQLETGPQLRLLGDATRSTFQRRGRAGR